VDATLYLATSAKLRVASKQLAFLVNYPDLSFNSLVKM